MRIAVDDMIVGEQYFIGSSLVVCTNGPKGIWQPGNTRSYTFKFWRTKTTSTPNPSGSATCPTSSQRFSRLRWNDHEQPRLRCDRDWPQVDGLQEAERHTQLQQHSDDDTQEAYANDQASITLGRISTYAERISFFSFTSARLAQRIGQTSQTVRSLQ